MGVDQIVFDLSNSVAEIDNAKLYYTGTSTTFATTEQVSSTVSSPGASDQITFASIGKTGYAGAGNTYYFWLTFDISSSGTHGTTLDASVATSGITITGQGSGTVTPSTNDPAGSRAINDPAPTLTINSTSAGSNQVAFNGVYWNTTEPIFAVTPSGTADRIFIEINTKTDFSGTAYTQTFSGSYSNTKVDVTCNGLSSALPASIASYSVRLKASKDAGSTWGDWTTESWVFSTSTGNEGIHYTTTDQFDLGTLTATNFGNYITSNDNSTTTDLADDYLQIDQGSITNTIATASDQYLTEGTGNFPGSDYTFITIGSAWVSSSQRDDYHAFRFQTVDIPQGATIESAYLYVYASNSGSEPQSNTTNNLYMKVKGADVDDCAVFASTTNASTGDPKNRTKTTAAVDWDISASWTDLDLITSPDIKTVVQEVIDRGGYAADNDIAIIVEYDGAAITTNDAHRYLVTGTRSTSYYPYLTATFTNFSNEIIFPDEALANIEGATTWDELAFDVDKASCGDCDIVFTVYDASDDSQIATGNTSPLDISASSAANIYVKAAVTRNGSPKLNSFTISAVGGSELTTLPIELISFDAECTTQGNAITWTTASELNNDYFILESSKNGQTFEEVKRLSGAGNSNQYIEYAILDNNISSNSTYYRLTQVDFDGQSETFDMINVQCELDKTEGSLTVQPNVLGGFMDVSTVVQENSFYHITIMDSNGRRVYFGEHFSTEAKVKDRVYINSTSKGIYLISVVAGGETFSTKVFW